MKLNIALFMPFLVLAFFTMIMPVVYASPSPKSLYVCAKHHEKKFQAWNINFDGTIGYQAEYTLVYTSDPAGIAMDESSKTLFITSEFSVGIEMFDAVGLTTVGYATAGLPSNLAGIDVDDAADIVYTVKRWSNLLYVLDWNPAAKTLTLKAGYPINLPGCSGAFGISLDETTGILWVADSAAGVARAYSIATWTEQTSVSFTPSHKPVDIEVDRVRGFVYTVSMSAGASVPSGCGSYLISKFDLATRVETVHDIGHQGVGIAVDEINGYVYVTGSPTGTPPYDNLEVWDPSTWTLLQETGDIGDPAGICIPQEEVAYNPLHLSKDDGVAVCVNPGDTITYTICFDNLLNNYPVHNVVIIDNLPPETSFVSASDGGTYASGPHTVTWNIGTLPALAPQDCVTLEVTVKSGTTPGITITNYAKIDSDETPPTTVTESTDICTQYQITVTASPAGAIGGTFKVTYTKCGTLYTNVPQTTTWTELVDANTVVTVSDPQDIIMAIDRRYKFDCYSPSASVTMDQAKTITLLYKTQFEVTFDHIGLDATAVGTVVTVDGEAKTYGDLPFRKWVDSGTPVSYSYETIVSSSVSGKRFSLVSLTGPPSPIIPTAPIGLYVIGNYKTQYLLTVLTDPAGLSPQPTRNPAGEAGPANSWWYDASTNVVLTAQRVTGYTFNYWDVDAISQGSGVNPITVQMNAPHTATAHYLLPPVGGVWVPINKTELLTPWIGLASLLTTVAAISVVYVKHRKKKQN